MFKNKKGSAMVFALVLITNALIIVASIVFISATQFKASGAISLTPEAFQKADSGLEYVLWEINKGGATTVGDVCDSFQAATKKCIINDPESVVFFIDENDNVLSSSADIDDVDSVKVIGEVQDGSVRVSRALRTTLFSNPN